MRPGVTMDVKHSRPRRDRPIFIDIVLIGAVMAALMYGGLRLLGKTHDAWDVRYGDAPAAHVDPDPVAEPDAAVRRDLARRQLEAIRAHRQQLEQAQAGMKNRRCVGGVIFAEVDGVLTNVGRC